jgi:hypothetical protein
LRAQCGGYPNYSCYAGSASNSNTGAACLNSKCNLGFGSPGPAGPGWILPGGRLVRPDSEWQDSECCGIQEWSA